MLTMLDVLFDVLLINFFNWFSILLFVIPVAIIIISLCVRKQNKINNSAPPQYKFNQQKQSYSKTQQNNADISFGDSADNYIKYTDEYFAITHTNIHEVYSDEGKLGEYLIWLGLRNLSGNRKFLFNLYIPNGDGKTTEIDVLLIHETGLYVFESKNYSGWIFGSEKNKNWTQCLKGGRTSNKIQFYNPIKQNERHIKRLKELLSGKFTCPIYSFIVFSERCELKKIELSSDLHKVIKRNELRRYVPVNSPEKPLSSDEINDIFELLYPYSQASEEVRKQHIADVDLISSKTAKREERKSCCPKCGSEMSLLSEENKNGILKQHWKCLNFKECGHCMYVTKNADTNND